MRVAEHRIIVEDARREGAFLRCTWHEDQRVFVVSHWTNDTTCTGATRVPAADAAELIGLFADGLASAARQPSAPRPATTPPRRMQQLRVRAARWWARRRPTPSLPTPTPTLAPVEELDLSRASWQRPTG